MLSKEAEDFLTNLKVYLTSYGKNEKEIQEIVTELEDHLVQAENSGKSIEAITGGSPKAYMDQLKNEMKTDRKEVISLLLLFFPLALSFVILPDALRGEAAYSLLEIIGNLSAFVISLGVFILFMRMESSGSMSKGVRILMYWIVGAGPLAMFLGIKLIDKSLGLSPVFIATPSQSMVIAGVCALFLIGYSILSKTWVTIIAPCIIIAPDFIAGLFTSNPQNQAMISLGIMYAAILLIVLYLVIQNKRKKRSR
ncbi:HAAS domain-containing protein [Paenibacillus sp. J2TS4]|uniref:HAAS domain-containing protein n=1 Tax=Paenibacillus sp. J2TS4 TaxID=2807194 RepID=UPI001B2C2533|nr:hypothetical protein [Paenibacillus sp. J2TS4]GIP34812.1 membrane protein [Paenibacillus sp. J2TS4]